MKDEENRSGFLRRKEQYVGLMEAIYTRQSVDRADSISVESQAEFCRREAAGENIKVYTDKGYSGKNIDRPAFQNMMADIEAGKVRRVIVYRLDRMSRSLLDFVNVMEVFQTHGVDFVSTMEKFDTGTPVGKAMLMIVMVFAQLERETIQHRVIDAYSSRSRHGFYMGGKVPFGFCLRETVVNGIRRKAYAPVPEETEIVRTIFWMYAQPQTSLGDVARSLEARKVKSPTGRPFSRSQIRDMVVNPCYARADGRLYEFFKAQGTEIANRLEDFSGKRGAYLYTGMNGKRKTLSLQGHILVLASHEGLVSSETWIKCRKKCLKGSEAVRPVKGKTSWLTGKMRCAQCGALLSVKVYHCKTKADNRYYLCRDRCGFGSLNADAVEEIVWEEMKEKLSEFCTLSKKERRNTELEEVKRKARIEQIDQEIDSLLSEMLRAGEAAMEYINDRAAILDAEKKKLHMEAAQFAQSGGCNVDSITGYLDKWEKVSLCDKIIVANSMMKRIIASQKSIRIDWKI